MARRRRTASQIAASRRNIVKAQQRSAQLRRRGAIPGAAQTRGKHIGRSAPGKKYYAPPARKRAGSARRSAPKRSALDTARNVVAAGSIAVSAASVAVAAHKIYKDNPDMVKSVATATGRAKAIRNNHRTVYRRGLSATRRAKK